MRDVSRGESIIRSAENELRAAMAAAVASSRYSELAYLARLADGVSNLLKGQCVPSDGSNRPETHAVAVRASAPISSGTGKQKQPHALEVGGTSRTATAAKSKYPRFETSESWITKIGWSKRERAEYRHHAPAAAAVALATHIDKTQRLGQLWSVEALGEVSNEGASERLPSYQVYLLIAWMRHTGLLVKAGRSGYAAAGGSALLPQVNGALGLRTGA
jgi:hypothetical protein